MVEDKTNGIFRILYNVNGEGIEITCAVCGAYSAGSELAKEKGNNVRIPVQVLEKTPYVCACGTEYGTKLQDNHWHLFMNIPQGLINKEALEAKLKSHGINDIGHTKPCDCPQCGDGQYQ